MVAHSKMLAGLRSNHNYDYSLDASYWNTRRLDVCNNKEKVLHVTISKPNTCLHVRRPFVKGKDVPSLATL